MNRSNAKNLIEIGVIVAGALDSIDRKATSLAIERTRDAIEAELPEFQIDLSRIRRPELSESGRVQPSVLLQQAAEDRDARRWDFAFIVTSSELVGNYSPYYFAALSRPLDSAVISLSLIDPQAIDDTVADDARIDRIAQRLSRLMLHALGHLTGLPRSDDPANRMFHPATSEGLDAMAELQDAQLNRQRVALAEIADQRLEEKLGIRSSYPIFSARAAWINRREIAEAVWGARPWEFPRRLSGLTIAAVSTIVILLLTAEAWDLALVQTRLCVLLLIAVSLTATTIYVVIRQQLMIRRGRGLSEQTVVTSASALAIVFVGMSITWLALLMIGLTASWTLFDPELVASWAGSSQLQPDDIAFSTNLQMSCFSASLGLLIGALGASFESQNYFRHVIFVDEEI